MTEQPIIQEYVQQWKLKEREPEFCFLCGHSHRVMAHWSSQGEHRALCHEDDHSCYTQHNHSQTSRRWGLYADTGFPEHRNGSALDHPQPPTIKDLDAAFNISTVVSPRKSVATAMERVQAALEGFSERMEEFRQGAEQLSKRIEARHAESVTVATGYARGGQVEQVQLHGQAQVGPTRLADRIQQSMNILPNPQFRQARGVDLASSPTPIHVTIDDAGFYHAAERATQTTPLTAASIISAMQHLRQRHHGQQEPLNHWAKWAFYGADRELLVRLNARLRGEDPGQPVNWPGLEEAQRRLKDRRP